MSGCPLLCMPGKLNLVNGGFLLFLYLVFLEFDLVVLPFHHLLSFASDHITIDCLWSFHSLDSKWFLQKTLTLFFSYFVVDLIWCVGRVGWSICFILVDLCIEQKKKNLKCEVHLFFISVARKYVHIMAVTQQLKDSVWLV
ncbi:hypothetical protein NE237_027049 [Protea cynaroides]|uniref:Uncharacterized protein n=1 Tax=Protea cynaroides TaxID=273540 RepID=A0A9Q0GQJ4_9MAGN|nr:hypothetical protein NE237_027049 [Protea cynaroides]